MVSPIAPGAIRVIWALFDKGLITEIGGVLGSMKAPRGVYFSSSTLPQIGSDTVCKMYHYPQIRPLDTPAGRAYASR